MNWIEELRRLLHRATREPPEDGLEGGITCQQALDHVFEWLDGELDPDMEQRVGTYLETCARRAFDSYTYIASTGMA